ncbi:MAG: TRIC cation channel family protein [Planctomycetota bacterium]|nr:TRIC cation channel family protein [Planctomycetota bacterium]
MKYLASSVAMGGGTERDMQHLINKTPYSMLGMDRPRDAVAALIGETNKM